jgi:hypothetical protein
MNTLITSDLVRSIKYKGYTINIYKQAPDYPEVLNDDFNFDTTELDIYHCKGSYAYEILNGNNDVEEYDDQSMYDVGACIENAKKEIDYY